MATDRFGARREIDTPLGRRTVFHLAALGADLSRIPYSVRVLLEGALRHHDGVLVDDAQVLALAAYDAAAVPEAEIAFRPGRVVLQDFTGVPAVVDLAAMRAAIVRLTGDPAAASRVSPLVPADLVIDHSVQVDAFASPLALRINSEREFARNLERYRFLKWGQGAFASLRVVPPATGIVHQVNLEYLGRRGLGRRHHPLPRHPGGHRLPHHHGQRPRRAGLGRGRHRGRGGHGGPAHLDAAARGRRGAAAPAASPPGPPPPTWSCGSPRSCAAAGVVGRFVEFCGPGLAAMPVADRATIANMCPEYGATVGFFPVDAPDPGLPAAHRARRGPGGGRRAVLPPAGPVARRGRRAGLCRGGGDRPRRRRPLAGRAPPPAGPGRPRPGPGVLAGRTGRRLPGRPRRPGHRGRTTAPPTSSPTAAWSSPPSPPAPTPPTPTSWWPPGCWPGAPASAAWPPGPGSRPPSPRGPRW